MAQKDPVFELLRTTYQAQPNLFTNEDVDFLRQRAQSVGADFSPVSTDVNLVRTAQQAVWGFLNGLSTLEVGDQPRNEVEQVFHSIGHLAGFMGFIPGAGTVANVAGKGFARGISMFMGREAAEVGGAFLSRAVAGQYGRSLPMIGANWLGKGTSEFIKKSALAQSMSFLREGGLAYDILGGAAHLGVASAISAAPSVPLISWDWDIENRTKALVGGMEAGAVFRVLGNTLKPATIASGMRGLGIEFASSMDETARVATATNVSRAVAAAMYMGLPSTLHSDPGLLQVYNYASGAAFGFLERSVGERQAAEFIMKQRKAKNDLALFDVLNENPKIEGWDDLSADAQNLVRADVLFRQGRLMKNLDEYSADRGYDFFTTGAVIEAKALLEFRKQVEDEVKSGKITPENAADRIFAADWLKRQMDYKHQLVSEGKPEEIADEMAFTKTAADVVSVDKEARSIKKEMDTILLKSKMEENAATSLEIFASEDFRFEVSDDFKESGVDIRFVNPIYDVARDVQQKPKNDQPLMTEGEFRKSVIKDSVRLIASVSSSSGRAEDFIQKFESLYGNISDEHKGNLKRAWLNIIESEIQPQLSVSAKSGRTIDVSEYTANGTRNVQMRPFSFAESIIRGIAGTVHERVSFINSAYDTFKTKDGDSFNVIKPLYEAIDLDVKESSVLPSLFTRLHSDNMMAIGGMKANDRIVALRSLVDEVSVEKDPETGESSAVYSIRGSDMTVRMKDKLTAAADAIAEYNKTVPDDKKLEDPFSMYEKQFQEYASHFKGSSNEEMSKLPEEQLRRMFEKNYLNNIIFIEALNSDGGRIESAVSWEVIMTNPDKFISSAQALNKRNQIIFAGEHRAQSRYFANLPGVVELPNGATGLNYVIIDSKKAINTAIGQLKTFEMRDGEPKEVIVDTHLDGIVMLRADVFDALMEYAGLEKNTGHQKGTILHGEAGIGLLLGKFAYHRAAPELDAKMMAEDIHMHLYDTAVKQTGLRDKLGLQYTPGIGYEYTSSDGNGKAMTLPAEALSINFSSGEHPANQMRDQSSVVQLYSNLNLAQAPKKVLDDMYAYIKELGMDGDPATNSEFKAYEAVMKAASQLEDKNFPEGAERVISSFDASKINVAKLGVAESIKILKDPYLSRTPLYDKLMRHILRLDRDGELRNEDDGIIDPETQIMDDGIASLRTGAMRAFENAKTITPLMVEAIPNLKNYAQSVMTSYIMKKAKRPIMPYSFKAIMSPYQLEYQHKYMLKPGEYMMDMGAREKVIEYHDTPSTMKEITLGDLWNKREELYNREPSKISDAEMALLELWEKDLQHAVIRVPADSVSGIRLLSFKGFVDIGSSNASTAKIWSFSDGTPMPLFRGQLAGENGGIYFTTDKSHAESFPNPQFLERGAVRPARETIRKFLRVPEDERMLYFEDEFVTKDGEKINLGKHISKEVAEKLRKNGIDLIVREDFPQGDNPHVQEFIVLNDKLLVDSPAPVTSDKKQDVGYGILLHPEDMKNLGGADLDIDSAFVYTKLPQSVKDFYGSRESMEEAYRYYKYNFERGEFVTDEGGNYITTTPEDRNSVPVFAPPKDAMKEILFQDSQDLAEVKKHPMGMFNPAVTIRANQDVHRANKILGPGLYHTRRLQAMHDMTQGGRVYFRGGQFKEFVLRKILSSITGGKALTEKQLEKLSEELHIEEVYGTFDKSGQDLRDSARAIVNYGADADGKYHNSDDIATMVLDKAFSGFTVKYRFGDKKPAELPFKMADVAKDAREAGNNDPLFLSFRSDLYKQLQQFDKLSKTYDAKLGRKMTLEEIAAIQVSKRALNYKDVTNIWHKLSYDILRSLEQNMPSTALEQNVFGAAWTGKYSITTGEFQDGMKAQISRFLASSDPVAQMLRDYAFRKSVNIATSTQSSSWQQAQDAADVASVLLMRSYTERALNAGVDMKTLEGIVKDLDEYKRLNAKRLSDIQAMSTRILAEYTSRDLTKSELYKEMMEKFRKYYAHSQELGDFASAWLVGSLYGQTEPYNVHMAPFRASVAKLKAKLNSLSVDENKDETKDELSKAIGAEKRASQLWHQTNLGSTGLNSPFVSDKVIGEYFDVLNEIAGATHKKTWTPEDTKDIVARSKKGASPQMQAIQPDAAAFTQPSTRISELTKQADVRRFREAFYGSIEPLAKQELDSRYQKYVDDLVNLLNEKPQLAVNFHDKILGPLASEFDVLPTTPNLVTLERLQQSIELWKNAVADKGEGYKLGRRHYFLPTKFIADKLAKYDANDFLYKTVPTIVGINDGQAVMRDMPLRTYFSRMEMIRRTSISTNKLISAAQDVEQKRIEQNFWLYYHLGRDAQPLYEAVTALREEGRGRQSAENSAYYGLKAKEARKVIEKYQKEKRTWSVPKPGGNGTLQMDVNDVVREFRAASDKEAEFAHRRWVYNEALDSYIAKTIAGRKDLTPEEQQLSEFIVVNKYGMINIERTFARFNQAFIEEAFQNIPILGQELLHRIQWQEKMMRFQVPDRDGKPVEIRNLSVPDGWDKDLYLSKQVADVLKNPKINRENNLDYVSLKEQRIFFDEYFPHVNHSQKALKRALEARLEALRKLGYSEIALQAEEMKLKNDMERLKAPDLKITEDLEAVWGDNLVSEEGMATGGLNHTPKNLMARSKEFGPIDGYEKTPFAWLAYNKAMAKAYFKGIEAWVNFKHIEKFEKEAPMGKDTKAWASFMKILRRDNLGLPSLFPDSWLANKELHLNASNPYYYFTDQAMWKLLSRMERKMGKYGKHDITWDQYRELVYNNGGIGRIGSKDNLLSRDVHLMKEVAKIGGHIQIMGRDNKREVIIIGKDASQQNRALAYQMAEKNDIPVFRRDQFDENMMVNKKESSVDLEKLAEARRYSAMLSKLSTMEGKWNLISLLSSTKTMMANITTGYTNTAISVGLTNIARASSLRYISSVMPEIKTQDDLNNFRGQAGALESFIKENLGDSYNYSGKVQQFITEGLAMLKKNPNERDASFADLARKYKLSEGMVETASSFMRVSERIVRGNAWMAHYLRGREALEANGYVFENNNHPWLIRMANRGVEGTQFLYDNATKPAFARTSVGKIFFRFQQWALSSVMMRQEIAKQAGILGYNPGSPEYDRYQRMLMADMFMLALASMFPATFFDSNLAPPLSTMVDIADLFYGDKKEKERAFYGALPYPYNALNVLSPPIMRIPTSVFSTMVSGDWERFAGYHVWTWFPFGRIARDVKRTVESPTMIIENMTNIPVHQIERKQRQATENKTAKQMFTSFIIDGLTTINSPTNP